MSHGFTLIELLVVIAIIAILAVVVVLTLNPAELLRQSRDANRVSDLATLSTAINLYNTDQSGSASYTLGNVSSTYLSVPDPTATSTNQCTGLGVASAPGTYFYTCSASTTYRSINTTGWIPVNFSNLSSGSPIGNLPVDPTNQTSSDLYYTYQTNGSQYEITAFMESQKYAKTGTIDGGTDPTLAESGSGISTIPDVGRGLVGYWPLNEGSGSSTIDWSGGNAMGTWSGTATGTSGYYSTGKTSRWAGAFDGSTDYITLPSKVFSSTSTSYTLAWWSYRTDTSGYHAVIGQNNFPRIQFTGSQLYVNTFSPDVGVSANVSATNVWEFWTIVITSSSVTMYKNGQSVAAGTGTVTYNNNSTTIGIAAASTSFFLGYLNDVRVYNRVLSASEIQQIYNAEK